MNEYISESSAYSVPQVSLIDLPVGSKRSSVFTKILTFFENLGTGQDAAAVRREHRRTFSLKKYKKILPVGLLIIIIMVVVAMVTRNASKPAAVATTDSRVSVGEPLAKQTLNREFTFPLKDSSGKDVSKIKYLLQDAELRNEIIVQGRPAYAIEGKTFLILTIKIQNTFDKAVNINARDYVRLTVNGKSSELIAADIHNDPVNVQPISTKTTRIGFPINSTDKNLVLYIGEIQGTKTKIPLKLN